MRNIAIILAAGSGTRSGFSTPKQLIKIAGKPIAAHAIKAFETSKRIDEIAIITSKDSIEEIQSIVLKEGFKKVKKVLLGGKERWESSWSAIEAYSKTEGIEECNFIFHDAVRPLVDEFIIERVTNALESHQAVDVVIDTVDTIVEVDESNLHIGSILNRAKLRNGQTPQAFKYKLIKEAYLKALDDPQKSFTDDCGIVAKYMPEVKICLVKGSPYNLKLTYNEDLAILDKLFQLKSNLMTIHAIEADFHKCLKQIGNKVVAVFGGTSGIGLEICKILNETDAKVFPISRQLGCDIGDLTSVQEKLKEIFQQEGRIDIVINSAGILLKQPLALMEHKDIVATMNTNYLGAVNVAYASYEYLKESHGSLLLFTSSSYTYGRAFYSLYSSTKAAVVNFVQALAEEWSEFGIKVNCLSPERTLTPMRVAAFGSEDPSSLLSADCVAKASIKTVLLDETGLVIDVKKQL